MLSNNVKSFGLIFLCKRSKGFTNSCTTAFSRMHRSAAPLAAACEGWSLRLTANLNRV